MDSNQALFLANAVVWIGVGGYIVFAAKGVRRLESQLKRLEVLLGRRQ